MWETTVVAERSQLVDAPREQVFSLLSDPATLSLRQDHFAFEVATPPGSGRLMCLLCAHRDHVCSRVVPEMSERCTARRKLKKPVTTAAAALIAAPPERVWETIYAPETFSVARPESVFCGGHVPGTPRRQVHEMQYQIVRCADGRLCPSVFAVVELVPGYSALVQETSSGIEAGHLLTPVAEGTRVELKWRAPARVLRGRHSEFVIHDATADLQATLQGYKAMIEGSSGPE